MKSAVGEGMSKIAALADEIRECLNCPLGETRIMAVPGEGEMRAGLMLVGEAPGKNEDETGRPFCGAAGKNLDLGLAAAGFTRGDVFVTSINKCRPPKNRDPTKDEKVACEPWLAAQVAALQPKALVALGRHGLSGLIDNPPKKFGDVRGQFVEGKNGVPVFCMLHPAAIIYRQAWRETYLADWKRLGEWAKTGVLPLDLSAA